MKNLLAFLSIAFFVFNAEASHITGGSLHWHCQGNGQYVFEMILYRHCDGITSPPTVNVEVFNHPSVSVISLPKVGSYDVSPDCNAGPGQFEFSCGNMGAAQGNGSGAIEKAVYQSAPITLSGVPPASGWVFAYSPCCRNGSIDNLISPGSAGSTIVAYMYSNSGSVPGQCMDNSPVYRGDENVIFCKNSDVTISTLPTDVDGDSLFTGWSSPLDDMIGGSWNPPISPANLSYSSGFSASSPLPVMQGVNSPPSLDPVTGQISYSSVVEGDYVMCIETESWRNGELIGKVRKDWTASIAGCGGNSSPNVSVSMSNTPLQLDTISPNHYRVSIEPNSPFQFDLLAIDMDMQPGTMTPQIIELIARGTQLGSNWMDSTSCANPPCATVTPAGGQSGYLNALNNQVTFRWNPGVNHLYNPITYDPLESPYLFELIMKDDFCPIPARTNVLLEVNVVVVPPVAPQLINIQLDTNLDAIVQWAAPIDTGSGVSGLFVYHDAAQPGVFTPVDTLQWGQSSHRILSNRLRAGGSIYASAVGLDDSEVSSDTLQIPIITPDVADLTGASLNGNGQVEFQWVAPAYMGSGIGGILLMHNYDPNMPQAFALADSVTTTGSVITIDAMGLNLNGEFYLETYDIINQLVGISSSVTLSSVGSIDANEVEGLKIYPIPATDELQIEFPENWGKPTYELRDLQGKLVLSGSLQLKSIDVSTLSRGSYLLFLSHDGKVYNQKVVLE